MEFNEGVPVTMNRPPRKEGAPDPGETTPPRDPDTPPNARRRTLIRGAAAAPLILSLASRPVWGTQGRCSLSGDIFSANVSNIDKECTDGHGCTPGFWKNNYLAWGCTGFSPGTCLQWNRAGTECQELDATTGTRFDAVFGYGPTCGGVTTLMEVLQVCNGSLDWHAVGAVLNAMCSAVYYGATAEEVVQAYAMARTGETDPLLLKDVFDNMNNRGCPLDAHGDCETGFSRNETGLCIPVKTST